MVTDAHTRTLRSWPRLHYWARRLATERSSPARVGGAVTLGVIIGTTPFLGIHLPLCLLLATAFRFNRALTYLAANISVPWMIPVLAFGSIQLGHWAIHGSMMLLPGSIDDLDPFLFGQSWLLGSFLLGSLIGVPAGLLAGGLTAWYRRYHPAPIDRVGEVLMKVAARYETQGFWALGYIEGKFIHDPVYRQLAESMPMPGPIVDVGCGRGQATLLVAHYCSGAEVIGIDWDDERLERARRAATGVDNIRYVVMDMLKETLPDAGTYMFIDLLHYLPIETQDELLHRCAAALPTGGHIYIRDVDGAAGWRARVSIGSERLARWFGTNQSATLAFRSAREMMELLEAAGFTTSIADSWGDMPFGNVFIRGVKI